MSKKVILGLSGGVDSSVAAILLLEAGFDVEAVFMKNWQADDNDSYCTVEEDLADAKAVANKLQIPFHTVNFVKEYWDRVFTHFLNEYQAGRTPNPDILCNKEIKFKAFLEHAMTLGADYIATGHYARNKLMPNGAVQLLRGIDASKDQSYFLHAISQQALSKTLFPVGEYTKKEIRIIANEHGLVTSDKKDSTGICFIGERNFRAFLSEYLLAKPGNIIADDGKKIGIHHGLMYYTLGQRQGLNIGGIKGYSEQPWFVIDKDIKANELIVGQNSLHPRLMSQGLICKAPNWIIGESPNMPMSCQVKTRYRQADIDALLTKVSDEEYCVMFREPQRAVTPGQSVVFYDKRLCLGGAVITERV